MVGLRLTIMSKTTHGGKREGAGRKALPVPKKKVRLNFDPDIMEMLIRICKREQTSYDKRVTEWIVNHNNNTKK